MPQNYTIDGLEYDWKTAKQVVTTLNETAKAEHKYAHPEGYGKEAAGNDFFLSYPLKRNEKEDSMIFQAVKYLPPRGDQGIGIDVNDDYNIAKKSVLDAADREKKQLSSDEIAREIRENNPGLTFLNKLNMGSGIDSRYQGFAGDKHNAKTKFYVELPIPNELSDTQSVSFAESKMNALEVVASSVAIGMMKDPGNTTRDVQNAIEAARAGALQDPSQLGIEEGSSVSGAVRAALSSLGLQAFGSNVTPNSLISRATGQILNNNTELLFEGVSLRNFTFNIVFAPRSKAESERVVKIIRSFKTSMAPKAGEEYIPGSGNFKGSGGIFLNAPDIFLIKYLRRGEEHPFLHKFKPCALTTLNVNYTGANVYSSYSDGTPTLIKMQMGFSEMNPIYAEDYKKAGKGVGY